MISRPPIVKSIVVGVARESGREAELGAWLGARPDQLILCSPCLSFCIVFSVWLSWELGIPDRLRTYIRTYVRTYLLLLNLDGEREIWVNPESTHIWADSGLNHIVS